MTLRVCNLNVLQYSVFFFHSKSNLLNLYISMPLIRQELCNCIYKKLKYIIDTDNTIMLMYSYRFNAAADCTHIHMY